MLQGKPHSLCEGKPYVFLTPSESLAGTQAEQIRKYLESIGRKEEAYNFPTYVTNSFHQL